MNNLKIYACSGVGDQQPAESYWTDETKTLSNSQAVNNLLAIINELLAELNLQPSADDLIEQYNEIDFNVVALRLAQRYQESNERLATAGNVLGYYAENGAFKCDSMDDQERAAYLEKVYQIIVQDIDINNSYTVSYDWTKWWAKNVVDLNKVGLTSQQQSAIEHAASGVGAISGDLMTYLNDSKTYFLYTFIPEAELQSWPKIIQQRRKKQMEIYNYCLPVYKKLGGTEDMMIRIIRTSIINSFKLTPEAVLRRIKEGKAYEPVSGVGFALTATAIASIVTAAISAVVAVVVAILQCVAQVSVAKYATPTNAELGVPRDEDLERFSGSSDNNKNLLIIGAAILGIILFKKNKKKRK